MVEALASKGDPESAHELIHEMLADADTSSFVNAVIYCSVLKVFSRQKQFDRVWLLYEEMRAEKIAVSLSAYNALIDACARSSDMARVPQLLQDMAKDGLEATLVTYSTILKGYCQENRLGKAFELLQEMKRSTKYRPDEITYNTLIDGCARYGLYDRGVLLLREMQEAGVRPSNFTLSVLVKLATRSRRPEKAFDLCKELTQQYNLRLNVQVYNNLVHACTANQDMQHALQLFEQMLNEKVRPDARTYTLLLRGSVANGDVWETAGLLRAAYGLLDAHPTVAKFGNSKHTSCGKLSPEVVTEILEGLVHKRNMEIMVQLLRDLRGVPGLKINPKLQLRLTSTAATDGR
jgi:pentatricopeptide repeat protein